MGKLSAISESAFAAFAEACTFSPSIPSILSQYFLNSDPNVASSLPKSARDVPPVNHDVKPSRMFAAVSVNITSASAFTPFIASASIFLAPSIKGFAFSMKSDKSFPILGNELDKPSIIPPTIPPTNLPIAFPTASRKLPPSLIIQVNPGISANAPSAVKTAASSATNAATPKTPDIAPGIRGAIALIAAIISAISPMPNRTFVNISGSTSARASNTLANSVMNKFTSDFTSSGNLIVIPSIIPIINFITESIISGMRSARPSMNITTK